MGKSSRQKKNEKKTTNCFVMKNSHEHCYKIKEERSKNAKQAERQREREREREREIHREA